MLPKQPRCQLRYAPIFGMFWQTVHDSNVRLPESKSGALVQLGERPMLMVAQDRFELSISSV